MHYSAKKSMAIEEEDEAYLSADPFAPGPGSGDLSRDQRDEVSQILCKNRPVTSLWRNVAATTHTYYLIFGCVAWAALIWLDYNTKDDSISTRLPRSVEISYSFCATAYACSGLLGFLKLCFERDITRLQLHLLAIYISCIASATYALLSLGITCITSDMKTVLFIPSRWSLYLVTMPPIWWILSHISNYSLERILYVFYLNWVMLVAGGVATVPWISWGHKVYWMVLSCVPFPELCFHMWRMISDAIDNVDEEFASTRALAFLRIYGQFSYQFFPAIYFAAFDGLLPVAVSEPLWAFCDWCLKMVMCSSLMEANFVSIDQRRQRTEATRKETTQMQNIRQLSIAIEAKDDFLAAISHELCTPLNGIIGLSEALLMSDVVRLSESLTKTITVMMLSGKRLLQLIYDILDASKMRQGAISIKHEEVDLRALVLDVAMLSSNLVHNHVDFKVHVQPVPKIIGDNDRIIQVLYNLVGNACKFTKKGSIVLSVRYNAAVGAVAVVVADTGCGISAEKVDVVFEAYEQGDIATARSYGGTGLGLHLVKELVKAHRGIIEVESVAAKGSTFTVWFPISPDERLYSIGADVGKVEQKTVRILTRAGGSDGAAQEGLPGADTSLCKDKIETHTYSKLSNRLSVPSLATASGTGTPHSDFTSAGGPLAAGAGPPAGDGGARSAPTPTGSVPDADSELSTAVNPYTMYHGEQHGQPQVLLVMENYEANMRLFDCLAHDSFKLVPVGTAQQALEKLSSAPLLPDIILVTSDLPDLSGVTLVRRIRRMFPMFAMPIIMMSGDSSLDVLRSSLEAGCMDFVRWPFYPMELLWRVRNHLESRGPLRKALLAGPYAVHPFKVSLLPYHHRHMLTFNLDYDACAGDEPIHKVYDHTAVLHISVASEELSALCFETAAAQTSILHQVHVVIHTMLAKSPLVPITVTPDAWTCILDTDAVPRSLGLNQLAAELSLQLQYLRVSQNLPIEPRIGLAFGRVCTTLTSVAMGCQLLAVGRPLLIAQQIADCTRVDHVGVMCDSSDLKAELVLVPHQQAAAELTGSQTQHANGLSLPKSNGSAAPAGDTGRSADAGAPIYMKQVTAQEMYSLFYMDTALMERLKDRHPMFGSLLDVYTSVLGIMAGQGGGAATAPASASAQQLGAAAAAAAATEHASAAGRMSNGSTSQMLVQLDGDVSGGSGASARISTRDGSRNSHGLTDKSGSRGNVSINIGDPHVQDTLQAADQVLEAARARMEAAAVPEAVTLTAPSILDVAAKCNIKLPWVLEMLLPQVCVVAFMTAQDMQALDMAGTEGVRLLTHCKRCFTEALLETQQSAVSRDA